ncbi:MAG: hypothetical protein ACQETE_01560 [Bacteroidota bacterium]
MSTKYDPILGRIRSDDAGSGGNGGGVWITDITPQGSGNVSNKQYDGANTELQSALSDTNLITVSVLAMPGAGAYVPVVTVNGQAVSLSLSNDKPLFEGTVDIDTGGTETITATHTDGASSSVTLSYDSGPEVSTMEFTGGYPGTQTELKAGDTFDLNVTTDSEMTRIEVYDVEACQSQVFNFAATTDKTVTVTIADRGNTTQSLRAKVRCMNSNGSYGSDAFSDNTVDLNNTQPSLSIDAINYPAGQGALKGSETADIDNTASDYDTIAYSSPNNQLSIASTGTFEASKTVTRIAGDYNDSQNNLEITATRAANGATTTVNTVVEIANVAPTISISTPASRLRSGGNNGTSAQDYTITITSDQKLASAPTVAAVANAGVFQGAGFAGGPKIWTRTLQVHDDHTKGTHNWTNLSATNKAGIEQTIINSGGTYELGGFVFRTLTVPAYPNREVDIGTNVADTSKLECTNLSKGDSGSLNFTFKATIDDAVDRFTISDGNETVDLDNSFWYNCDASNASSNTSGTQQIEIEEVV